LDIRTNVKLSFSEVSYIENVFGNEDVLYVEVNEDDGNLLIQPHYRSDIKRIRRITGYFSDASNFNKSKQSELRDRVSHV
jgi:hypothetical protein